MKNKTNVLVNILVMFLVMLAAGGCSRGPVDVTNQIMEQNEAIMASYLAGDTSVLKSFYTNDALLLPANMEVVEGREAIGEFWAATLGMGIREVVFATVNARQYGDIAIEQGTFSLLVEGDVAVDQGKYIVVWKNEKGIWKVSRDIWNHSTMPPQSRAQANDTIMVVLNHVLANKVAQFETFNTSYLIPAAKEFNAKAKMTVRTQKPLGPNKDGTFTYIYFMDPYVGTYNYDISFPLEQKYGKEKANEYLKMYIDCLKEGKSQVFLTTETDW